ncbi:MAG: signal peptidase II [Flavobacteriaceae bacterium]
MTTRRHPLAGWTAALLVLALDQASKYWFVDVYGIAGRPPLRVTGFFDILLVWNYGISYGLFQQDGELGRYVLIGLTVLACLLIAVWMRRSAGRIAALSLGLILGGAVGNAIDRIFRGAVVDLFHFHWGDFSWYVFNLADAAIVAGVAGLLYDSFLGGHNRAQNPG